LVGDGVVVGAGGGGSEVGDGGVAVGTLVGSEVGVRVGPIIGGLGISTISSSSPPSPAPAVGTGVFVGRRNCKA
jgi:hypothetical protein